MKNVIEKQEEQLEIVKIKIVDNNALKYMICFVSSL